MFSVSRCRVPKSWSPCQMWIIRLRDVWPQHPPTYFKHMCECIGACMCMSAPEEVIDALLYNSLCIIPLALSRTEPELSWWWGSPCVLLSLSLTALRRQTRVWPHPTFYMGARDSNSCLHTCTGSSYLMAHLFSLGHFDFLSHQLPYSDKQQCTMHAWSFLMI